MLLVAAAALHESTRLPFGTPRNPGPGFVPWWAGVTLAGLSLILVGQGFRARRGGGVGRNEDRDSAEWQRVVGLIVVLGLYVLALEPLGYPICTFLLVLAMLRPATLRAGVSAVGLAVIFSGASYVLFAVWLKVPLPPGPLAR
jgi:putative tricarboxylic transport membrane protein